MLDLGPARNKMHLVRPKTRAGADIVDTRQQRCSLADPRLTMRLKLRTSIGRTAHCARPEIALPRSANLARPDHRARRTERKGKVQIAPGSIRAMYMRTSPYRNDLLDLGHSGSHCSRLPCEARRR